MISPPHDMLSVVFQWIGFLLAGLLLVMVLLIGVGHFHQFIRNWWKDQRAISRGDATPHAR